MRTATRTARTALAAPALLVALALAGCGDDGGSGGGSDDDPISKADFIEQADQICADGAAELEKADEEYEGEDPSDPAVLQRYVDEELEPNLRAQFDGVRDLGFPEGDEELLGDALDDADEVLDSIVADPQAALLPDENPFADVNATLSDYGLTECGSE